MKSNDAIPADEMLLAEAIAAAKANGKAWCDCAPFATADGKMTTPDECYAVCALGALHFAGAVDQTMGGEMPHGSLFPEDDTLGFVINGNDTHDKWTDADEDRGESMGWAFRCAMTQEEP